MGARGIDPLMREIEPWQTPVLVEWAPRLCDSFHNWTGRDLIAPADEPLQRARALFEAPVVVVSHGTQSDPLLNYGNRMALRVWEMEWHDLIAMPSRLTAESGNREARARLLTEVERNGFVADYEGVRISATGRRFRISGAIIWNVIDRQGNRMGQAASFAKWDVLEGGTR